MAALQYQLNQGIKLRCKKEDVEKKKKKSRPTHKLQSPSHNTTEEPKSILFPEKSTQWTEKLRPTKKGEKKPFVSSVCDDGEKDQ